ncbi:MAG: hypothetical protein KDH09_17015 [Chrysiogenetes bacterium]|nr:hypothetical protein [Chrysiogenetes bacterium]
MKENTSIDPIRGLLVAFISGAQFFLFVLVTILTGRDYLKSTRKYA